MVEYRTSVHAVFDIKYHADALDQRHRVPTRHLAATLSRAACPVAR